MISVRLDFPPALRGSFLSSHFFHLILFSLFFLLLIGAMIFLLSDFARLFGLMLLYHFDLFLFCFFHCFHVWLCHFFTFTSLVSINTQMNLLLPLVGLNLSNTTSVVLSSNIH